MSKINKKQIQLNKLNQKVEKILSENGNDETLKNNLRNIVNQFGELKLRPINKLIKEAKDQYKMNVKINNYAINNNVSYEKALKTLNKKSNNRKIKLFINKASKNAPKKLNKYLDEKLIKRLMKKISKLHDKVIPESQEFLITFTLYKEGISRNPNSNIQYEGRYYQLSSSVQKSFNVDLTKGVYKNNDVVFISS